MNRPTAEQTDRAIEVVLNWQQTRKAREMKFYSEALARGELSVIPFKEVTKQKSRCDLCLEFQPAGIRRYWYRENAKGELHCWWFAPCEKCFKELMEAVTIHQLVAAQLPQLVTI